MKECPFCGGGQTYVIPNQNWTGMRYVTHSYTLRHICKERGSIQITRNTEEEVLKVWNNQGQLISIS